jgi:periplasmic divalent cation tolerance protein
MSVKMVYMTAGSPEEARQIGRSLVESRLAACVNIIEKMTSIFRWEGAIEEGEETVLIAKTTEMCLPKLIEHVKHIHSYECPCIVSLPVEDGHKPFLDWVAVEVDSSK